MIILVQFAIGLLFGTGLIVAGMSDPAKVLNFLDLAAIPAGTWDASLMFVLAGAIAVGFIGFRLVFTLPHPLADTRFHLPEKTTLDAKIIIGPAIFGLGWGLVGLCPGPAFTALGLETWQSCLFVAAMFAGMYAARAAPRINSNVISDHKRNQPVS